MTGVYVVEAVGVGRCKVGWSHNPRGRLIGLQVAAPVTLVLRYTCELAIQSDPSRDNVTKMAQRIEGRAHELLAHLWWSGEWFDVVVAEAIAAVEAAAVELLAPGLWIAKEHEDPEVMAARIAASLSDDPFEGLV